MDSSSLPSRRRLPDDDDDLEEGQFIPTAYQQSSSGTDDDDAHPPHGHYRRRRLTLEELLALGGDALPSPTPSCDSDGTISDDPSTASVFRAAEPNRVVGGWSATGRRGWTGGKLFAATATPPPLDAHQSSHSNVSGEYSSSGVHAVVVHHQPPLPYADQAPPQLVHHQPPAPQQQQQQVPRRPVVAVPRRAAADRAQREYTCKFCGKAYTSHQALGGHVAKHKSSQREAEAAAAAAAAAGMVMPLQDGGAFLAAFRRARRAAEAPPPPHHQCRKCHKVFATGVALGGHMRVHYTGPPIVPARRKNRVKRGLAPLAMVEDVAVAAPPPTGLSLALPIKAEEAPPSTAPPAGAGRVVRLFGIDISQKLQEAPSEQQCSGTTEEFSAAGGQQ